MTRPPRPTKALSVRQVRRLLAEGRQLRVELERLFDRMQRVPDAIAREKTR